MLSTLKKKKKKLGADTYNQEVVSSLPIAKGIAKMAENDKQTLPVRLNAVYYFGKNERPYSESGDLLTLQEKNGVKMSVL